MDDDPWVLKGYYVTSAGGANIVGPFPSEEIAIRWIANAAPGHWQVIKALARDVQPHETAAPTAGGKSRGH